MLNDLGIPEHLPYYTHADGVRGPFFLKQIFPATVPDSTGTNQSRTRALVF